DEWRTLIREELENGKLLEEKVVETVQEKAKNHKNSVVICTIFIKNLKKRLSAYSVKVICLENYWKPPLEILKTISASKGIDKIPDNIINLCIKQHLNYLNYVLLYENVDTAHSVWSKEFKPYKRFKQYELQV
ncbi:MAG: hypothetical protein QXO71_07095, partial [Candidatus Jordarchaeaceae archaeon]